MTDRLACRQQMHAAERLARLSGTGMNWTPALRAHLIAPIESAYLSPACEPAIAQRIHVALDIIA